MQHKAHKIFDITFSVTKLLLYFLMNIHLLDDNRWSSSWMCNWLAYHKLSSAFYCPVLPEENHVSIVPWRNQPPHNPPLPARFCLWNDWQVELQWSIFILLQLLVKKPYLLWANLPDTRPIATASDREGPPLTSTHPTTTFSHNIVWTDQKNWKILDEVNTNVRLFKLKYIVLSGATNKTLNWNIQYFRAKRNLIRKLRHNFIKLLKNFPLSLSCQVIEV